MADRPPSMSIYTDRRIAVLLGLGFASGLPNMLTGRTLGVWATDQGVDLATVGLFSLISLPYTFKFIWAPLIDYFQLPLLGRRRGWLVLCQIALVAAIAFMAFSGPRNDAAASLGVFAVAALIVAFFSATQDVVEAAYRTDALEPNEIGAGASASVSGYRVAMLASGAGAVLLADHLDWTWVYLLAAGMMLIGVATTLLAKEPATYARPESIAHAVVEPLREFLVRNRWRALVVLLFIVLFKLPDYMAARMTDPLLLKLGFAKTDIAVWSLGMGTAVTIPGVLLGGWLVTRFGLLTGLVVFGIAQAASNAGYLVLALRGETDVPSMMAVVAVEYFCTGLVAAGFVSFLMSQCDRRYSATQFALFTGLMGLSASLGGAPTGFLVEKFGFVKFFSLTMLIAIPGMMLLPLLGTRRSTAARSAINAPA